MSLAATTWHPLVTVVIEDSQFRVLHDGTQLAAHPRTVVKEVTAAALAAASTTTSRVRVKHHPHDDPESVAHVPHRKVAWKPESITEAHTMAVGLVTDCVRLVAVWRGSG